MREAPLQAWALADLRLPQLLNRGHAVQRQACDQTLRLAVLGDCATQHYVAALEACVRLRGVWTETYEAEIETIQQEVLDPQSALRAHRPQVVVIFNCVQALQQRFMAHGDARRLAEEVAGEVIDVWARIRQDLDATVVQHGLCLPVCGAFGHYSLRCPAALTNAVARINAVLADEAEVHGVRLVDTEAQAAYWGKRVWFDERLWCQARQALSPRFLPPLCKSVSDVVLEGLRPQVKCVVLDLDNTMWGGVLGDAGVEGLEIGGIGEGLAFTRFQAFMKQLERRGILLAVCSKNDQERAEHAFATHPEMVLSPDDLTHFVANWDDKATNILAIREALGIGLDSFVFLDDSPFERDFVRSSLPEVQVPELPEDPAEVLGALARWNLFESSRHTPEDAERTQLYKANATRRRLQQAAPDLSSYLAQLAMRAEVGPVTPLSLPRALQLIQRSNQFNLTTRRHSEGELRQLTGGERSLTLTLRLRDRLGDNGIIAVVLGRVADPGPEFVIDTWIMSCRVLNRRVEELTLACLVEMARRRGCVRLVGQYIETPKNGMVADLYQRLGFEGRKGGPENEGDWFVLQIDGFGPLPPGFPIVAQWIEEKRS